MTAELVQRHVLTVGLEDFFQVDAFNRLIEPRQWSQFERRLERSTTRTLELLDAAGARATFFVLGWIADIAPELVRSIADRGHEIASRGYDHRSVNQLSPSSFRDDLSRSREAIERAAGVRVLGHRAARLWYRRNELWALEVLAAEGYAYDSSLAPFLRRFANEPWRRYPHSVTTAGGTICELPISTTTVLGQSVPIAGGNYARQLPASFIHRRVQRWMHGERAPFVMYFHVWELDPEQPRVPAPLAQRVRQYRNLDRMRDFLTMWISRQPFGSAADLLGLQQPRLTPAPEAAAPRVFKPSVAEPAPPPQSRRIPVSIVVPCFNTARSLPQLRGALDALTAALGEAYEVRHVLVDDGSTDATWDTLEQLFGDRTEALLVRHPRNVGVAAATRTGLLRSRTEIVCSLDAGGGYDPLLLRQMIPLLTDEVDIVTASPYHPDGTAPELSGWRLGLTRTLSRLYRLLLGADLFTFTSPLRVYRRSAVAACRADRAGHLGTPEILGRVLLAGGTVVEHPASLEGHLCPRPAIAVARAIGGHLGLAAGLVGCRLRLAARQTFAHVSGMSSSTNSVIRPGRRHPGEVARNMAARPSAAS